MDFEIIREKVNNDGYKNILPYPDCRKYNESHVFDENQSVKWNKEEVIRQNEAYKAAHMEYQSESYRLSNLFHAELVEAIAEYCGISENKADHIYTLAYDSGHGGGYHSVVSKAEELADMVYKVMK